MTVTDVDRSTVMSVAVIEYDCAMARWEPDSPGRLEQAALALYGERGFESTTVAEIAARAGVTERTFFRHFADKREVLFSGGAWLEETMVDAVLGAPESAAPFEAIGAGLESAGAVLEQRREFARKRASVIAANAGLQERELIKLASLAAALAEALRQRGVEDPAASLTAEAGIAVFRIAFERWVADDKNQAWILQTRADDLCRHPEIQAILQRYAGCGPELRDKLLRHLEFLVENRRSWSQAR